jgi:transcriptional repressor NrdR
MKCPYCGNDETKVIDKRDSEAEAITRRRRQCLKCEKRFTTYERVESINLVVVKKDGNREQFDRQKLERGILKACEKRPTPHEKIMALIDEVEAELRNKEETEVKSSEIGNLVIRRLKKLDKVAYIRFASVYREFADIKDFEEELSKLLRKK